MDDNLPTLLTNVVPQPQTAPHSIREATEGGTVALSYRELASQLGVALEAAKARARRGGWARLPGNDGTIRVQVPVKVLEASRTVLETLPPSSLIQGPEDVQVTLQVALAAQTEAHRAELARLDSAHQGELERAAQGHAAEMARLHEGHAAELARLQAAHMGELARSEQRLTEPPSRRGLWRWLHR